MGFIMNTCGERREPTERISGSTPGRRGAAALRSSRNQCVLEQNLISSEVGPGTVETSFKERPVMDTFTFEMPLTVWFLVAIAASAVLGGLLRYGNNRRHG